MDEAVVAAEAAEKLSPATRMTRKQPLSNPTNTLPSPAQVQTSTRALTCLISCTKAVMEAEAKVKFRPAAVVG